MKAILGIALTLFLATMLIVTFRSTQIVAQKEQHVRPVASFTHSSIEHELAILLKQGQVNQVYEGEIVREPRSVYVVAVVGVVVTITTAAWTTGDSVQHWTLFG